MGLLPPEEPRLTLKNFMRTLGQAAAQDPTGAEARVRAQMAARRERHEARIAAEKVSPAERRARETAKRRADADLATAQGRCHVAVFRLRDLRSKKLLHKLDASAREHFITGMSVVHPTGGLQLVIAEGGPQAIKAYKTLMLRRIAWHEDDALAERSQPDAYLPGKRPGVRHLPPDGILPEGVAPPAPGEGANACALVWEGILPKRSCEGFRTRRCATEAACLRTLRECGYEHFWKAAQADAQAEIA
ncbi:hypothetical protein CAUPRSCDRAFT_5696 [Caulochytrium protostelioides]|nr:hypothetical protein CAUPRSCDRAFT_5696 [Caulochytrium protostelioides]